MEQRTVNTLIAAPNGVGFNVAAIEASSQEEMDQKLRAWIREHAVEANKFHWPTRHPDLGLDDPQRMEFALTELLKAARADTDDGLGVRVAAEQFWLPTSFGAEDDLDPQGELLQILRRIMKGYTKD